MDALTAADPRRIGRYTIIGRLGSGGMGTVYLGRSPSGRLVAVKTVHRHLAADPEFRARFEREVTAARRVNGFYTADVVDADASARTPWMATRYIEGPSLTRRVREGGPLPAADVFTLAAGVAEALVGIHAEGLVHRDLKPSNVVLSPGGPQVIDFGIAHLADADTLSTDGEVVGTFEYISPEQSAGRPVTPASDVFSLGGLLHFAATGRPAFGSGRPWELMHRIHSTEPDLSPIGDARLRALVADCLAKDPAARPTPRQVVERAAGRTDTPVRPGDAPTGDAGAAAGPGGHGRRIGRRSVLAGGIVVAAGAGGLGYGVTRGRAAAGPRLLRVIDASRTEVLEVHPAPDGATFATVESSRLVRLWDTATGRAVREFAPVPDRLLTLAWSPDGRTLATASEDSVVRLLDPADGTVRRTLTGHRDWVSAISWAPGGGSLVSASYDLTFRTWDARTGDNPLTISAHGDWLTAIGYAPDGSVLATASLDQTLALWRSGDGGPVWRVRTGPEGQGAQGAIDALAWSSDGRTVATGSRDGLVRLWDRTGGAAVRTLSGHSGPVRAVAWAPDGRTLLTAGDDGTARLWDAAAGTARQVLRDGGSGVPGALDDGVRPVTGAAFTADGASFVTAAAGRVLVRRATTGDVVSTRPPAPGSASWVAVSPDGATLASAGGDGVVRLWARADGALRRTLGGHVGYVNAVAFSPDGRLVADAGDDGGIRLRDAATGRTRQTFSRATNLVGTLISPPVPVYAVGFTPDGRTVLGGGGTGLRWWDVASGALVREVKNQDDGQCAALAAAPDGSLVATGHERGVVRLRDAGSGAAVRTLEGHRDWVLAVAWAPDGRVLASAGSDGTVRLWDPGTGALVRTLPAQPAEVQAVAWAPDGGLLVTGCSDGVVRVFAVATGTQRAELAGHRGRARSVVWTPDGGAVASAGSDGTVRVWDVAVLRQT